MKQAKVLFTGVFAAFAASICCITPFLAFVAGVSGVASSVSLLEPLRPYLAVVTIGALGLAWYQHLRSQRIACECEEDQKPSWFRSRGFLIAITVFATAMLLFPSYVEYLYPKAAPAQVAGAVQEVMVQVDGMTCAGCEEHIEYELGRMPGIAMVKADADAGTVKVAFAPQQVTVEQIEAAIEQTGYHPVAYRLLTGEQQQ